MMGYDEAYGLYQSVRENVDVLEGFIAASAETYDDVMDAGVLMGTDELAEAYQDLDDIDRGIDETVEAILDAYGRACSDAPADAELPQFSADDLIQVSRRGALVRQTARALFDARPFDEQYQFVIDECERGRVVAPSLVGSWMGRATADAEAHPAATDAERIALERTYGHIEDLHLIEGVTYGTDDMVTRAREASRAVTPLAIDDPAPALDEYAARPDTSGPSLGW